MADLLNTGLKWLEEQRHGHLTREITYERGADSITMLATIGRSDFEQIDEFGVVHRAQARDFLIRTQDLVIGGTEVLPQAGDRIRETDGGVTYVHDVMSPAGQPPWRYSDAFRRTLRIHTKLVSTE
ncbi:MAG: hypothetical protein KJ057_09795 [Phycisphaerae bacterium]|nr:MAG: hypothetical protein EDS66_15890 [Planctomycetota bacterium]MBE7458215.1 hypothetical protein [Planctomycetia bacterium]MCL4718750.1 hypothetical protein [Phycisphaerae bacterium]